MEGAFEYAALRVCVAILVYRTTSDHVIGHLQKREKVCVCSVLHVCPCKLCVPVVVRIALFAVCSGPQPIIA